MSWCWCHCSLQFIDSCWIKQMCSPHLYTGIQPWLPPAVFPPSNPSLDPDTAETIWSRKNRRDVENNLQQQASLENSRDLSHASLKRPSPCWECLYIMWMKFQRMSGSSARSWEWSFISCLFDSFALCKEGGHCSLMHRPAFRWQYET